MEPVQECDADNSWSYARHVRHGGEDERLHLHADDPALGHVAQKRYLVGCSVLADGAVQSPLANKGTVWGQKEH